MVEVEPFGVDYERYAIGQRLKQFVKKYDIKKVLEMPAHGAKAAPSLYSLGFALAGCKVTLVNGDKKSKRFYEELGIENNIEFIEVDNLHNINLPANQYDFVWNFVFLPTYPEKELLIQEMKRVSKNYICIFSVNRFNVGFPMHRFAHRLTKIPWTHGDINFNSPYFLKKFFEDNDLPVIESDVVDCPIWPDSVGFRDIRLHRSKKTFEDIDWEVPYIKYLKEGFPKWIKRVYLFEKLPLSLILKYLYAHIFYIIGKKKLKEIK